MNEEERRKRIREDAEAMGPRYFIDMTLLEYGIEMTDELEAAIKANQKLSKWAFLKDEEQYLDDLEELVVNFMVTEALLK